MAPQSSPFPERPGLKEGKKRKKSKSKSASKAATRSSTDASSPFVAPAASSPFVAPAASGVKGTRAAGGVSPAAPSVTPNPPRKKRKKSVPPEAAATAEVSPQRPTGGGGGAPSSSTPEKTQMAQRQLQALGAPPPNALVYRRSAEEITEATAAAAAKGEAATAAAAPPVAALAADGGGGKKAEEKKKKKTKKNLLNSSSPPPPVASLIVPVAAAAAAAESAAAMASATPNVTDASSDDGASDDVGKLRIDSSGADEGRQRSAAPVPASLPLSDPRGRRFVDAVKKSREHHLYPATYDFDRYKSILGGADGGASGWVRARPHGPWASGLPAAIAMDCEMVGTEDSATGTLDDKALCRLSVVDASDPDDPEGGKVLLDTLVKPDWPVVDWRTAIHGICESDFDNVQFTLRHAQEFMMSIMTEETVVIGHAVNNDLASLKLEHHCNADTSFLYELGSDPLRNPALKDLCMAVTGRAMPETHCSVNDSRVSLVCLNNWIDRGGKVDPVERAYRQRGGDGRRRKEWSSPGRDRRGDAQTRRVYVGNLSWDVAWQDLKDHMRNAGEVVFAEVKKEHDGRSKGCGIVEFATAAEAEKAISTLTDTELKGRMISVREDRETTSGGGGGGGGGAVYGGFQGRGGGGGTSVFVGNLAYDTSLQDLKDHMRKAGNVDQANIFQREDGRSKGCGIVRYQCPQEASLAIRELQNTMLTGRPIFVREDREQGSHHHGGGVGVGGGGGGGHSRVATGCQIWVGNLSSDTSWRELKDHFRQCGDVRRAEVMEGPDGQSRGFGTVRFYRQRDAANAIQRFNGVELQGRVLEVKIDVKA